MSTYFRLNSMLRILILPHVGQEFRIYTIIKNRHSIMGQKMFTVALYAFAIVLPHSLMICNLATSYIARGMCVHTKGNY